MKYLSVQIFWVQNLKGEKKKKKHENTSDVGLKGSWLWLNTYAAGKLLLFSDMF